MTAERVGIKEPNEVAKVTVEALRSGLRYVTVPKYYLFVGKFFE